MNSKHPLEVGICPITRQKIYNPEEWILRFDDGYYCRMGMIGQDILISHPVGFCEVQHTLRSMDLIDEILKNLPKGRKINFIEDYSRLESATFEARTAYNKRMVLHKDQINSIVYITDSKFFKFLIRFTPKVNFIPFQLAQASSYEQAVHYFRHTDHALDQKIDETILRKMSIFQDDQLKAHFRILNDNILLLQFFGVVTSQNIIELEKYARWWIEYIHVHLGFDKHFRIIDFNGLKDASFKARRRSARFFRKISAIYPCECGVMVGATFFVKLGVYFGKTLMSHAVYTSRTIPKALALIVEHKSLNSDFSNLPIVAENSEIGAKQIEEMLYFLGTLEWDKEGLSEVKLEESNPLFPIYEAITVIKLDVDGILKINREREAQLMFQQGRVASLNDDLQEALKESEKQRQIAEHNAQAKQLFLANMSHEIRTPMNAVIALSGLLSDTPLTLEQKDYIDTIRSSSESLLGLINDILDWSKIESGKIELESIPIDLAQLLNEIKQICKASRSHSKTELILECSPHLPRWILGDPLRLKQILINLTTNALKFTPHGRVILSAVVLDGFVEFSVQDNGIGISAENTQRLFQLFSQVDATITRQFGGTGLGLSISQALVKLMQGEIQVESEIGVGSRFYFKIPLRFPLDTQETLEFPVNEQQPLRALSVLVAEDNLVNQKVILKLFEKLKIPPPRLASNGVEAVEFAENEVFDVILMDLQMPHMDGLSATEHIRSKNIQTPIIALTANALDSDRKACLNVGMNDFLTKPITAKQLQACLLQY